MAAIEPEPPFPLTCPISVRVAAFFVFCFFILFYFHRIQISNTRHIEAGTVHSKSLRVQESFSLLRTRVDMVGAGRIS